MTEGDQAQGTNVNSPPHVDDPQGEAKPGVTHAGVVGATESQAATGSDDLSSRDTSSDTPSATSSQEHGEQRLALSLNSPEVIKLLEQIKVELRQHLALVSNALEAAKDEFLAEHVDSLKEAIAKIGAEMEPLRAVPSAEGATSPQLPTGPTIEERVRNIEMRLRHM